MVVTTRRMVRARPGAAVVVTTVSGPAVVVPALSFVVGCLCGLAAGPDDPPDDQDGDDDANDDADDGARVHASPSRV